MVSCGEKAKIKKVGSLNQGRSYGITTVKPIVSTAQYISSLSLWLWELKGLALHTIKSGLSHCYFGIFLT